MAPSTDRRSLSLGTFHALNVRARDGFSIRLAGYSRVAPVVDFGIRIDSSPARTVEGPRRAQCIVKGASAACLAGR